jgi:ribose transport system ATP-binding protein
MGMPEALSGSALEVKDVSMRFGDVWVLNDVNLRLPPGAVHAVVGHNGAGKSTLMKIALGVYQPTRGEVWIGGRRLTYNRPAAARELGLGMVFQERSLIPTLNGLDNLFLNSEHLNRIGFVQRAPELEEAAALLEQLDVPRSLLELRVSEMSTIEQELLEIAKALRLGNKVLILDEPTAPLGRAEIQRLFDFVRTVAQRGTGIVLITHHLAEVFAISDQVTCLREGRVVLASPTKDTSMTELIRAMLGHHSVIAGAGETSGTRRTQGDRTQQEVRLSVNRLQVGEKLLDVSFEVAPGEIVGVAGVVGSGRSTLLRTLFGDVRPAAGAITLDGKPYRPSSPAVAINEGVYLIPEDRALFGILLQKSINENTVLPVLSRFVNRLRLLQMSRGRSMSRELVERLDIRARSIDQVVGELSGGNQQKVVLAKALAVGARLMLLDEPTFGVDIGAVKEIVRQVREMAQMGAAVLWATSDIREMLEVADRVIILRDGVVERSIRRDEPDYREDIVFARMQRISYAQTAVLVEARDAEH